MNGLYWPGEYRADGLFDDAAFLVAMTAVESAWLSELVASGVAPADAEVRLAGLVGPADFAELGEQAERIGNPAGPLVTLLRARLGSSRPAAAQWLHRGLTSQDVVDTALMLCARTVDERLRAEITDQLGTLVAVADQHRNTPMVARTLTQQAIPYTFGTKLASWISGICDAAQDVIAADDALPGQFGGAAGTLAATVELVAAEGVTDPATRAVEFCHRVSARLGLSSMLPWHTARSPITRLGNAWVSLSSAYGRIANDVLVLARPEIGELSEPAGRGGSSTMPQKANPILSVLIRRAALAAPTLGAQLQLAAAEAVDERPDGAWHLEWSVLQTLGRHTAIAAAQLSELVGGLQVHTDRMRANLDAAGDSVLSEQHSMASLAGREPRPDYRGASDLVVDAARERGTAVLDQLSKGSR